MHRFIGGSHDGQNFLFDPKKYEGNVHKTTDLNTGDVTIYNRYEVGEHTFWVDEALSDEDIQMRIKKLLENQ